MPDATPNQMRIFVSHSSKDKAFCDALVRGLREAGADVLYDEHDLGAGVLRREIMRELAARPIVLVILSKAAFASDWVQDECEWAYNLIKREPNRLILPIVAGAYEPRDFNILLYLESLKRIEAAGQQPFPQDEAIRRTLRALALTPAGKAPVQVTPQPAERVADLLTRGKALFAQRKYAEALPFFERVTEQDPGNVEAWASLGRTYNPLSRVADGLTANERSLELNPQYVPGWFGKGNALFGLKRYEEALAAYDSALTIDPTYGGVWRNKSHVLRRLGRMAEAEAAERQARELDG